MTPLNNFRTPIPIPETSPSRDAARSFLHGLGLQMLRQRIDNKEYRPLGIRNWKHHALMSCGSQGIRQDEEGFPRRINELADDAYFRPRPWWHLHRDYVDASPSPYRYYQEMAAQSAYIVSPIAFPEFEPFVLKATGFDDVIALLDAVDGEKHQEALTV